MPTNDWTSSVPTAPHWTPRRTKAARARAVAGSSMTGLAKSAGLADKNGTFPRLKSAFVVEGLSAVVGGATSGSSNTVYVDSAAGIGEGARTGLASVVTGVLFLGSMFFTPLTSVVPLEVAAAALVVVGAM